MRLTEIREGVPIYACETPASQYRFTWHWQLCKKISSFLISLSAETFLRGSHIEDLSLIAKRGSDHLWSAQGSLIYVAPHTDQYDVSLPLSHATTAMIIYQASGLRECHGDKDRMGVDHDRYQFLVDPREALLGIIDLREVTRISKRLRN